jgi:hypothetical protein
MPKDYIRMLAQEIDEASRDLLMRRLPKSKRRAKSKGIEAVGDFIVREAQGTHL